MDPVQQPLPNVPADQGDADANLPLLIVGPSGSGKTFELTLQAIHEIYIRLNARNGNNNLQMKALCMTPFNTATSHLTAKVMKGLDIIIPAENPLLAQQRPLIVDPICTTIHHACRKWLAAYGHLIDQPNMAEVCAEDRAKRLLELLQSLEHDDGFYEQNQDVWNRDIEHVRNELVEELTLGVRNFEFLENAIMSARACKNAGMFASRLQEFIRLYKINDFRLVDEIFERFRDDHIDAAIDFFPWYDAILRHNRLYDFEDLVIFGLRLVNTHAHHIMESEKIHLIVIDDFQNSSAQQQRLLNALMSFEGCMIKLLVACNDHHNAQTEGGQLEDLDRTAYAFTGAHISFSPDELMARILPVEALYQHVDFRVNRRSSSNVQQIAYGIFNRHLLDFNREGLQYQPVAVGSANIPAEAKFIQEEVDRIHLENQGREESLSSVAIMTRTNANVRFLVDALTRLDCRIRVMGLENIDICSNEALDILSFLGTIRNTGLHHLVERSLVVFSKCRDDVEPHYADLPEPELIRDYINDLEDDPRHIAMSEHHRQYLGLLKRLSAWINMRGGLIHDAVDLLLEDLQYKERVLRTRLAPDGSPSPPPNFDVNQNAPHPSSDYAGARWQNVRSFLIRLSDFDTRIGDSNDPLDLFLRECHAYAPEQLAYLRREPKTEITISTMHYGIGSEYDVVFISGAEKGSLPCSGCQTDADIQQDKALFHLCMLCARQRLYFCFLQNHGLTTFLDNVYQLLHLHHQVQE